MMRRIASSAAPGFEPLSGMDAGFLYMETPTLHMHTLKVAIVDASGQAGGIAFSEFRRGLMLRLPQIPSFTQRLAFPLLGLTHPVWVQDERFDIDRHIAYRQAPAPGGMPELQRIVSEIASVGLPRDRPLWEITMVDGLEAGRVAFVCKLHHAMADGSAALGLLFEMMKTPEGDADPERAPVRKTVAAVTTEQPTRREIARWSVRRILEQLSALPALLARTVRGLRALLARDREGGHPELPAPFSGPRTRWNRSLTARRSFATATLAMDDLKRVRGALGVTLNDVLLGVCSGALRAHLDATEGGIPSASLTASVPINTRPDLVGRMRGNHVGHLTASLCSDIADPVERIHAIHRLMQEAKERHETVGGDLMERWIEYAPPGPFATTMRFWSRRRMADILPPPVSLVVSNVPGPREPVDIGETRLDALYSVGPILEGIGLNITGWSYAGTMYVVGLGCPDQIEDLQGLVDRLPPALAEVLAACEPRAAQPLAEPARPAASAPRDATPG